MARMTAARAAVEILKREGVSDAFGVPGAAINPFYAALKAAGGSATPSPAMSRAPRTWPRATPAPTRATSASASVRRDPRAPT